MGRLGWPSLTIFRTYNQPHLKYVHVTCTELLLQGHIWGERYSKLHHHSGLNRESNALGPFSANKMTVVMILMNKRQSLMKPNKNVNLPQ